MFFNQWEADLYIIEESFDTSFNINDAITDFSRWIYSKKDSCIHQAEAYY